MEKQTELVIPKPHAILLTGPSGNGKTTLTNLVGPLFVPKFATNRVVLVIDMSDILIKWGMQQHGPIGDELRKYADYPSKGFYIPDSAAIPAFYAWLDQIMVQIPSLVLLLIAGVPRTFAQLEVLKRFNDPVVGYIDATRQQSDASIFERFMKSKKIGEKPRLDDAAGKAVMDTRWDETVKQTRPMMSHAGINGVFMDRKDPLNCRIKALFDHIALMRSKGMLPIPDALFETATNRFSSATHRVHEEIRNIEFPVHPEQPGYVAQHRGINSMAHISARVFASQ